MESPTTTGNRSAGPSGKTLRKFVLLGLLLWGLFVLIVWLAPGSPSARTEAAFAVFVGTMAGAILAAYGIDATRNREAFLRLIGWLLLVGSISYPVYHFLIRPLFFG